MLKIASTCISILFLTASAAMAQDLTISLGDGTSLANRSIYLLVLLTVLSLVPGLAIMITCFPFIVTVFAILRQAIGLQQSPPNMLIVSLALFLTYFVMEPTFSAAWQQAGVPFSANEISLEEAFQRGLEPFHAFMSARTDPGTLQSLHELRGQPPLEANDTTPLAELIPAFLLSEITRAFEIGFLIYLPFLIIDLVVAAVLMSMGMMMVPPAVVSMPFKLAFFVIADGWILLSEALVRGYL